MLAGRFGTHKSVSDFSPKTSMKLLGYLVISNFRKNNLTFIMCMFPQLSPTLRSYGFYYDGAYIHYTALHCRGICLTRHSVSLCVFSNWELSQSSQSWDDSSAPVGQPVTTRCSIFGHAPNRNYVVRPVLIVLVLVCPDLC